MHRNWAIYALTIVSFQLGIASGELLAKKQESERAEELVLLLNAPDFKVREQATQKLIKLGLASLDALQQARKSPELETRLRSEQIYETIQKNELEKQLHAFIKGAGQPVTFEFPAWDEYVKVVGDSKSARELYTRMLKQEKDLLIAFQHRREVLDNKLQIRMQTINKSRQTDKIATVSSILLLLTDQNLNFDQRYSSTLYSLCNNLATQEYKSSNNEQKALFRSLLKIYLHREIPGNQYRELMLAIRFEMKQDAVKLAEEMLNSQNVRSYVQYTTWTIAQWGDASNIKMMEKHLANKQTVIRKSIRNPNTRRNVRYEIQMRDVTLLTLLKLTKQSPEKYGMKNIEPTRNYPNQLPSFIFENDSKRTAGLKMWKDYRARETNAEAKS